MSKEGDPGSRIVSMAAASLLGGALAAAISLVLLLGCAAAVSAGMLSEKLELHATIAACVVGSFCGGLLTKKRWERRALLAGLSAGGVFFLLLLTVNLAVYKDADLTGASALGVLAGCLCGGAIAGVLGQKGKKKKKRRNY